MPDDDRQSIPPEVVEIVRKRDSGTMRAPTAIEIQETIVRNAISPDESITCPCCGMPRATTPERVVDYLRMALGADGTATMPERLR